MYFRKEIYFSSLNMSKKKRFLLPNCSLDAPRGPGETPYVPHETPHELQETTDVLQGVTHVPHRGDLFAKSSAAFLAAGLVSALQSSADLYHTLAACATKVLAARVFLPVSVLLLSNKVALT
jgi:hypothetical protein